MILLANVFRDHFKQPIATSLHIEAAEFGHSSSPAVSLIPNTLYLNEPAVSRLAEYTMTLYRLAANGKG